MLYFWFILYVFLFYKYFFQKSVTLSNKIYPSKWKTKSKNNHVKIQLVNSFGKIYYNWKKSELFREENHSSWTQFPSMASVNWKKCEWTLNKNITKTEVACGFGPAVGGITMVFIHPLRWGNKRHQSQSTKRFNHISQDERKGLR